MTKIPKIIHYCWFGGNPLPEMAQKCIASWKKYLPDYKIIEWNESNFDINYNDYVKEAYEAKKYAFVSDVARLYALVNYGGIYMDTDVEVIRSLDNLLNNLSFSGFESNFQISTGLMACRKGNSMFLEFLEDYKGRHFIREDGSFDFTTNVTRITNICLKYGLKQNNTYQVVNGFTLYPKDYLCPKDHETKIINITKNTYTIHHFDGSWKREEDIYAEELKKKYKNLFLSGYITKFIAIVKFHGLKKAFTTTYGFLFLRRKKDKH